MRTSITSLLNPEELGLIKEAIVFLNSAAQEMNKIMIVKEEIFDSTICKVEFLMPDPFSLYTLGKVVGTNKLIKQYNLDEL